MKKFLSVLITTAVLSVASQMPSQAGEMKKNYIGAGATFIDGTTGFGVISKFGIADNISVRPFVSVLGTDGEATAYFGGVSASYDFNISNSDFTPYAAIGYASVGITDGTDTVSAGNIYLEAGADYNVSDSIVVNGNYKSVDGLGAFSLGAGFRF